MTQMPPEEAVIFYLREFSDSIGRLAGAERVDGPHVRAMISHRPVFNRFYDASIPSTVTAADVAGVGALCGARVPDGRWIVDASRVDPLFESALQANRFELEARWFGMWREPMESPRRNATAAVEKVKDETSLRLWADLFSSVGNDSPAARQTFLELFLTLGWSDSGWSHWVARLGGRPAAVASMYQLGEIGAIDWVATLPAARGNGLATLLVEHILASVSDDVRQIVLTSTEMGRGVYSRLGFRDCSTLHVYHYRGGAV